MHTHGKVDQDWMNYVRKRIGHESNLNYKLTRGFKGLSVKAIDKRGRDIEKLTSIISSPDFYDKFNVLTRRFTRQLLSLMKTNHALSQRQSPFL